MPKPLSPDREPQGLDPSNPLFKGLVRGMLPLYLLTLVERQPLHGHQMIRALAHMSGDEWRPSPGSVYPILKRLEAEGLVSGRWQRGSAAPKRVYRLTEAGRAAVPTMTARLISELEQAREVIDLHLQMMRLQAEGHDG